VFAGSALALVATSALAVLIGEALSRAVPAIWLKRGAGGLFIVLGILFLLAPGDDRQPTGGAGTDGRAPDGSS
jgi:putative Ca2+/H+ antiporter (TMEM165/GDT1 family)